MRRGNTRTISNDFEYLEPNKVEEAIGYLKDYDNVMVLAGGTDLIIAMKKDEVNPDYLLNIKNVEGLDKIKEKENELIIGSTATFNKINSSNKINKHFDILAEAASDVGGAQVKNMGTIGGNLCTASPVASTASPLLTLNAEVKIENAKDERTVLLEEFFIGAKESVLKSDELLKEIKVPYSDHTGFAYKEVKRVAEDLGKLTVAILLKRNEEKIEYCRIGLGAVAPTPIRARKVEKLLKDSEYSEELLEEAGSKVTEEISPIDDVRSTAEYRDMVTGAILKDCIKEAWEESD